MTVRFFKIAAPIITVLSIASLASVVSANSNQSDENTRVSNPLYGSYASLGYSRSGNYANATLTNLTSSSRLGGATVTAYTSSYVWIDQSGNSIVLNPRFTVPYSVSATTTFSSSSVHYVDHTGTLYNSTTPTPGTLEYLKVRSNKSGSYWIT